MARRPFKLLSDVINDTAGLLDQGRDEPATDTFKQSDFIEAANDIVREIHHELGIQHEGWNIKEANLTVNAGDATTDLPADCLSIVGLWRLGTSGNKAARIHVGNSQDGESSYSVVPEPTDQRVRWGVAASSGFTALIRYVFEPLPLCAGIIQDYGASTITLGTHEARTDDTFNGGEIIVGDENLGQYLTRDINDYDGANLLLTADSAWGVSLEAGVTRYSMRPQLPVFCEQALTHGMAVRMLQKVNDEKYELMLARYEKHMARVKTLASNVNAAQVRRVRNDRRVPSADPFPAFTLGGAGELRP